MNKWLLLVLSLCMIVLESRAVLPEEMRVIEKCLQNYGGLTRDNSMRLERYAQWTENYEEVPCFTQCYLSDMFDFYDKESGFNEQGVVKYFGRAVYDACRARLGLSADQAVSSCEHAYAGFHCITSMENDPHIFIEKMPNVTRAAKAAMKRCLPTNKADSSHLKEYENFPVDEPIPCYTRCFILQLHLFEERTRRWRLPAMRQELGVPQHGAHVSTCHQRSDRNSCNTFYQQFTCYVLAAQN